MAVALPKDSAVYVSLNKEAVYGTPITVARKLTMGRGWRPTRVIPTILPDAGMTTGVENTVQNVLTSKHYAGTLQWDWVHPDDIGFCLGNMLGTPTFATVDTTGSQHFFHPDNAATMSHTIPSFSLEETFWYDATPANMTNKYGGCLATTWNLSKGVGQPATMSMGYLARVQSHATSATPAVVSSEPCWLDQPVNVWLGTALNSTYDDAADVVIQGAELLDGTPTSLQATCRSFSIDVTQISGVGNLQSLAASGIMRAERDIRTYALSMVLELENDTFIDYITTEASNILTNYAVEIDWDSDVTLVSACDYGVRFAFPKVRFTDYSVDRDDATGKWLLTLTGEPQHDTANYGLGRDAGPMIGIVWNLAPTQTYAYSA